MGKESFLIYKSFYPAIEELSNEDLGKLFRAIFEYQISGIETTDVSILMAFRFFKNQFRLDDNKYEDIVKRNKSNGLKGGRPKTEPKPKNPLGLQKPKKPDNDNENVNDNEKEYYRIINHLKLSFDELDKLLIDYEQKDIDSVLDSIENYKKNKNYTSLYLTAKNWLGRDYKKKSEKPKIVICR